MAVISADSGIAVYLTLPVIVKAIEVLMGFICFGIAFHDIITNFEELLTITFLIISNSILSKADSWLLRLVGRGPFSFVQSGLGFKYKLADQLTCRIAYLAITTFFLAISLIQLTWFPASIFTGHIKSRIISGVVYHFIGFAFHLAVSLFLISKINPLDNNFINVYTMRIVVIIGLINAALYLLSAILALWSFIEKKICQKKNSSYYNQPDFLPFKILSPK